VSCLRTKLLLLLLKLLLLLLHLLLLQVVEWKDYVRGKLPLCVVSSCLRHCCFFCFCCCCFCCGPRKVAELQHFTFVLTSQRLCYLLLLLQVLEWKDYVRGKAPQTM
jgi:hypothetical protein